MAGVDGECVHQLMLLWQIQVIGSNCLLNSGQKPNILLLL